MKFSPKQREALSILEDGRFFPTFVKEEDGWHARWHALGGIENGWVDEYVREAAMTRLTEDAEEQRHETLHDAWMMALKSRTGLVIWDKHECAAFAEDLSVWNGNAEEDVEARHSLVFRLMNHDGDFFIECEMPRGRRRLKALGQASFVCPPLRGMRGGSVKLTLSEAEHFVHVWARELCDAGYRVEGADLAAEVSASAEVTGNEKPHIELTVRVAGEKVSADEIRFLLDQGSTLVFFRNRWIEVDRGILKEALRALERGIGKGASPVCFALGLGHVGQLEVENVKIRGWLRGLVNELKAVGNLQHELEVPCINGLLGELRDYQRRGVEWLSFLTRHGFGALLADDMGLGKTIQVIGWMLSTTADHSLTTPFLVVAPLSLLANWRHELKRFAPSIKVYIHQGDNRHLASGFRRVVGTVDVVLTSYNLLVKDYTLFSETKWEALVLDEAQAIKNPDAQVSRAVRALMPPKRIAMTGTPIENSVSDVWSIEDFLNPGFLGDRRSFDSRFARPMALDGACAASKRLKRALEPFVLRRLKTDPKIASELGEKREVREYCELTAVQRRDYEAALDEFNGGERGRGDIFALLTRLKLICDGTGKLERLADLLESIFECGESALVFTQYAKVGAWLEEELSKRFHRKFPFLHGGLSAAEREDEIRRFERRGPSAFILSLRAGGFGLNLTKATHVIHFDRWWNPAVENQATDRAHRIGQTKTVFVHLFICAGTLEEHVDKMLERKSAIAGAVISDAEWLEAAKLDE